MAAASLQDYFREAVGTALDEVGFHPSEAAASYVVDLLCDYTKFERSGLDRPLALVLAEARSGSSARSVAHLKQVGDEALYIAGFFSDSLRRSDLDPGYYVVLGTGAYGRLSRVLRRTGSDTGLVVVFNELGEEFARFVEVLDSVRGQTGDLSAQGLGELYDRWLRTGSSAAKRKLHAAGLLLVKKPGSRQ